MNKKVTIVFSVLVGVLVVACSVLGFWSSSLNGKINTLNEDTQTFKTDTAAQFDTTKTSINGLDSNLSALETDANTFKMDTASKFTATQSSITSLNSNLNAFQTQANAYKTDIDNKLSTAQSNITSLNTNLTNFKTDTASQFDTVQNDITGINSSVASINSNVAGLNTDLTSLAAQYSESTMNVRQVYDDVIGSVCQIIGDIGSGSGFVYSADGLVITCWHVVDGQSYLDVILHDGSVVRATVVGSDQNSDVAVLRLPGKTGLTPLPLADSSVLVPGEPVIVVGNPLGIFETVVYGVISRTKGMVYVGGVGLVSNLVQFDAAANHGNSGGPVFNNKGEVIGIDDAGDDNAEGMKFAVSSNKVKRVADAIIDNGSFTSVNLPGNYTFNDLTPGTAISMGLDSIFGVIFYSATNMGQVRANDVATAVDGIMIRDSADLFSYIAEFKSAGDTITLTVVRNGTRINTNLVLVAGWIDINSIG